jgi:hypothetical protein
LASTTSDRSKSASPPACFDRLDDREVGDALAVGQATAPEDLRPPDQTRDELLDQPRLTNAGRPEDREELARGVAFRRVEGLPELRQLSLASL